MTEAVRVSIIDELQERFHGSLIPQETCDGIPTVWAARGQAHDLLRYLKEEAQPPYKMLFDLTAIDERMREHRTGQPKSDFTIVYTLLSYQRNSDIRVKVALEGENPSLPSIVDLWPMANWYERELWDMFGITASGHPLLRRILMPPTWQGHPLRKEDPARGTEIRPYVEGQIKAMEEANALQFDPVEWGMTRGTTDTEYMYLNVGPQHPGTHGPFRIILALDGEEIVDAIPDIGFHHRGAEKMAERQSWHTYIPYTDRVDYLSGVLNEFPYVMAVEKLAGIEIPPRAQIIRVMLAELFRISNHLVFLGTYAQDLGAMSPVFFMFNDRERALKLIEAVTGARMHPGWFRIGGTSADLPNGWDKLFRDYVAFQSGKMDEYDRILLDSPIFRGRTLGIAPLTTEQAVEWGVTGPFLRSTGLAWDWRKQRPYSSYDQLEFDVPTGAQGDCYDRAVVHAREIRESLRIIRQCVEHMPAGPYKSAHPLTTPPVKERTMHDIETLIDHFLSVSWGPVIPPGEALVASESSKGSYGYYAISDGSTAAYRVHIRTASFPHLQTIPLLARGLMLPDLLAILGSIDFVMGDVDR
jgi:NADH-quinone oxidoreductase subunit C/D